MTLIDSLSHRENQVLLLIVGGHSNRGIAEALGTSPKTIDNQRTSLYRKLKVRNAAQAVTAYWRRRL